MALEDVQCGGRVSTEIVSFHGCPHGLLGEGLVVQPPLGPSGNRRPIGIRARVPNQGLECGAVTREQPALCRISPLIEGRRVPRREIREELADGVRDGACRLTLDRLQEHLHVTLHGSDELDGTPIRVQVIPEGPPNLREGLTQRRTRRLVARFGPEQGREVFPGVRARFEGEVRHEGQWLGGAERCRRCVVTDDHGRWAEQLNPHAGHRRCSEWNPSYGEFGGLQGHRRQDRPALP